MPPALRSCLLLALALSSWGSRAQGTASADTVAFSNGEVSLVGTLLLPAGVGPFAGAVLVHGSGTSDRQNPWTSAYASALVTRGVAVLYPDKRGSGASGGDWREASFQDLAGDALAALDLLRAHPRVDSTSVGLIGFSQGGYVVPVAATLSEAVAFVVDVSGSVVPLAEQIGDELRQMGRTEGLAPDEIEAVLALHDLGMAFVEAGAGWSAYAEAIADAKAGRLGGTEVVSGFPTRPDSPAWTFLRAAGPFDPLPYWRNVTVPTLFVYGGRDENVDVYKSARIIEAVLTEAGVPYGLLLFRENGHALYREDVIDLLARWIQDGGEG